MKPRTVSRTRRGAPGFTRVEALTLALMTAMLVCLQLPLRGDARRVSRASMCIAGMRQLQLGWILYAADHDGRIVAARGGGSSGAIWARGGLDFSNSPDNWSPELFPGTSPLLPYAGNEPTTYHCPSDPVLIYVARPGTTSLRRLPRVRSRSLNCWVGGGGWREGAPWRYATSINQLTDPGPADTFTFIDEREDSINDGCLEIDMSGFPSLRGAMPSPELNRIVDYPAYWHRGGAGVAFADGHVSIHSWTDPRTIPRQRSVTIIPNVASPHNADVTWMQARTPRLIP